MNAEKYRRNIPTNYLFVFFSNIQFTTGLWMIYLSKMGFSLIELGLLESIFHISSTIFEVPSGALADLIGRKFCRMAGRLAFFISLVIMFVSDSFLMQAAGFAICAFGYNLESGSGEAFIYDTLKTLGEQSRYKKIAGFIEVAFQAGMIISFIGGGFLASGIGYNYVFLFSGCTVIISFLIGLAFDEPDMQINDKSEDSSHTPVKSLSSFGRILRDSIRLIKSRPRIIFLILFSETILTFTTSLFFYIQNYFKDGGREEYYIGIVYALSAGLSAMSSMAAEKIEKVVGEKLLLIILPLILAFCLWGVSLTDFAAAFFVITGFVEGVTFIVISDYLNRMIPSEIRATVLSFRSMAFSLLMVIMFPLIGTAAELLSFRAAFMIMAAASTVLTAAYAVFSIRWSKNQPQP